MCRIRDRIEGFRLYGVLHWYTTGSLGNSQLEGLVLMLGLLRFFFSFFCITPPHFSCCVFVNTFSWFLYYSLFNVLELFLFIKYRRKVSASVWAKKKTKKKNFFSTYSKLLFITECLELCVGFS